MTELTKWKSFKTPVFLQSDCIFAMILMQEETLQEPSFSRTVTDMHLNRCLDPLRASIWDRFGYPKSIQNPSGSDLGWHHISDLEFKGWHPAGGSLSCTLDPGPWYSVIYILEFRARFARAQFSYLDFEGLSLAGKWCAAALLWDPDSLSWFIHFSTGLEV